MNGTLQFLQGPGILGKRSPARLLLRARSAVDEVRKPAQDAEAAGDDALGCARRDLRGAGGNLAQAPDDVGRPLVDEPESLREVRRTLGRLTDKLHGVPELPDPLVGGPLRLLREIRLALLRFAEQLHDLEE